MIIYSFKTFPELDILKKITGEVYVFSRLKKDLAELEIRLLKEKPNYVIGFALAKGKTRLEPTASNQFNMGRIMTKGEEKLALFIPDKWGSIFKVSKKPTYTFCNWTMYHIQNFINQNNLETKFIFIHVNLADIEKALTLARTLKK